MNFVVETFRADKLKHIGGAFEMDSYDKLQSVSFDALESVDDDFTIAFTSSLDDISFPNLENILGSFFFFNNNGTTQLASSFEKLKRVDKCFIIDVNSSLESISGFNKLVSIGEQLRIEENSELTGISGFRALQEVQCCSIDVDFEYYSSACTRNCTTPCEA